MSLFLTIRHVEFFTVRGRLFDDFVWVHRREPFGFTLLVNPGVLLNVVSLFKRGCCKSRMSTKQCPLLIFVYFFLFRRYEALAISLGCFTLFFQVAIRFAIRLADGFLKVSA